MDTLVVRRADVTEPLVLSLLERHVALMRASSPEECCHVLDPDALAEAHVWVALKDDVALGIGALQCIEPGHGELKSMHTLEEARGHGVARRILAAILGDAQQQGMTRVSLETGSADMFGPARKLYEVEGFEVCPPFAGYQVDPLSVFMTRLV